MYTNNVCIRIDTQSVHSNDNRLTKIVTFGYLLSPPYVIGQAIYIFALWFLLLSLFFSRLVSAVAAWP